MTAPLMWMTASLALAAGPASGTAKSTAVVALGHCEGGGMLHDVRTLRSELSTRMPGKIQPEEEAVRSLGGVDDKSLADVERMLQTARQKFYNDANEPALKVLRTALEDLDKVPPSPKRWKLRKDVLTLAALTHSKMNRQADARSALVEILRVEPDFHPDPSLYPPSLRNAADVVRGNLSREAKRKVEITTSPSGVPVYVGGKPLGRSPLTITLVPGDYRVEAEFATHRGSVRTFRIGESIADEVYPIELRSDFDGSIFAEAGPCLQIADNRKARLTALTKLGSLLNVENVVALRIDEPTRGEKFLVVSSLNLAEGEETREARIRIMPKRTGQQLLGPLADFVTTGQAAPPVEPAASPARTAETEAPVRQSASSPSHRPRTDDAEGSELGQGGYTRAPRK